MLPVWYFQTATSSAVAWPATGNSCWGLCTALTHQDPFSICMWPKPIALKMLHPWRLWKLMSVLNRGKARPTLTKKEEDTLKVYIITSGFCLLCSAITLYSVVLLSKQHPIVRKHTLVLPYTVVVAVVMSFIPILNKLQNPLLKKEARVNCSSNLAGRSCGFQYFWAPIK